MTQKKRQVGSDKQVRDAVSTRARILDKSTEIFSKRGYDGTSAGDIVKVSKINKRMIYHYFGDKEGLLFTQK